MAKLNENPVVNVTTDLRLSEYELRALLAITVYGSENFIKAFREHLGASIEGHEVGISTLFDSIGEIAPRILSRVDDARAVFVGTKKIKP